MGAARRLLALFAVSGFAGVIYESIWSQYLKLFLGHAAYAQTIVLVIFMGGMAVGAWLASSDRMRRGNLLLAYVLVEAVIGLAGLLFHPLYVTVTAQAYDLLLPNLHSPLLVTVVKNGLAAALILPQSVLLGMTFPLLTAGTVRVSRLASGRIIATLYFVNSLGAAIGVLVSAFVLIPWLGLPGTIKTAALLNFAVAAGVFWVARDAATRDMSVTTVPSPVANNATPARLLLAAALVTGAASFVYEIVWVRMLNMVLGSTTHSFELMLSAFILGLALGGAWIRRYIDTLKDTAAVLGFIQIAMAVLAMTTIAFYDFSFDLMSAFLVTLARTTFGYIVFLCCGALIAMLIMLPTTICAGMTLPLITQALLRDGRGERAIGQVYALNTLGAILGVVLTIHVLIPGLGLKYALLAGAFLDLGLGLLLILKHPPTREPAAGRVAVTAALLFALITAVFVQLDSRKMAAGVFRTGNARLGDDVAIDFQRDGKTASVSVFTVTGTHRVISTNGKPDASMEFDRTLPATFDESIQILTGALPLMVRPDAKRVAMIGIGSGMSTQALLRSPTVETVDTIEIEPAMVAGAKYFLPHVKDTFEDPRSRIHIEDARTFFATSPAPYDLIISEPSNPWVSGVSGLFTQEFYRLIRRHLAAAGVLAQWMQLYEMDLDLVSTVFTALATEFPHVLVYEMADGNLLIMASMHEHFDDAAERVLAFPGMKDLLARVEIRTPADPRSRRIATGASLQPLFASYHHRQNSDYSPILDQLAPYKRFLRANAVNLSELVRAPLPVLELLGERPWRTDDISWQGSQYYRTLDQLAAARSIKEMLARGAAFEGELPGVAANGREVLRQWVYLNHGPTACTEPGLKAVWRDSVIDVASVVLPYVEPETGGALLDHAYARACPDDETTAQWFALLRADRDARFPAARDGGGATARRARRLEQDPSPAVARCRNAGADHDRDYCRQRDAMAGNHPGRATPVAECVSRSASPPGPQRMVRLNGYPVLRDGARRNHLGNLRGGKPMQRLNSCSQIWDVAKKARVWSVRRLPLRDTSLYRYATARAKLNPPGPARSRGAPAHGPDASRTRLAFANSYLAGDSR